MQVYDQTINIIPMACHHLRCCLYPFPFDCASFKPVLTQEMSFCINLRLELCESVFCFSKCLIPILVGIIIQQLNQKTSKAFDTKFQLYAQLTMYISTYVTSLSDWLPKFFSSSVLFLPRSPVTTSFKFAHRLTQITVF